MENAGDDPDETQQQPNAGGYQVELQDRPREGRPGNPFARLLASGDGHGFQNLTNRSGKMLSPPRPEKIELVSDGIRNTPRENTPTITSACNP